MAAFHNLLNQKLLRWVKFEFITLIQSEKIKARNGSKKQIGKLDIISATKVMATVFWNPINLIK
jgi:hypothetical protein